MNQSALVKQFKLVTAILILSALFLSVVPFKLFAQVPVISYSSPQIYTTGVAIQALAPTNTGGVVPGPAPTILAGGFNDPISLGVDAAGNVYVVEDGSGDIKKIPSGGGTPVVVASGFNHPTGVVVDAAGNIYVADNGNNLIKEIPVGGGPVLILGSGFSAPYGIAIDAAGNIYVGDSGNNAVKKILAGSGTTVTLATGFSTPSGVAVDANGNVYVADRGNNAIKEIPKSSSIPGIIGSGFYAPNGVAVDAAGDVYIADTYNNAVKKILVTSGAVVTLSSGFNSPTGVVVDAGNNIYVADNGNTDVKEIGYGGYSINPVLPSGLAFDITTGIISGTPAGPSQATNYTISAFNSKGTSSFTLNIKVNPLPKPVISYVSPQTYNVSTSISPLTPTNTGGPISPAGTSVLASGFSSLRGVAADAYGNVYVADNGASVVEKIPAGGGTPVVLGSGFNHPVDIAVDVAGNVYVTDGGNNEVKEIVASTNAIVVLGSGFSTPYGIAVDVAGNVYIGDYGNNAVKKIPAGGGTPVTLATGFDGPTGVAVDAAGNVYVADRYNNAVKEIPESGGIPITLASGFNEPNGVAVDVAGNVYVADQNNGLVKEIPVAGGVPFIIGSGFIEPIGIAVDAYYNVYVADLGSPVSVKQITPGGYSINPALPAGLSFNTSTGTISGTPAATSPATNYTVTAFNSGGSATATVNITVNPYQPPVINYNSPQVYTKGVAITPLTPTSSGVAPVGSNSPVTIGSGFNNLTGVAVDAQGNVYVAENGNNAIKKIPVGGGSPIVLGSGFITPTGVAVDAQGNVYVADAGNNQVKEIVAATSAIVVLGEGFSTPYGVAVDTKGNLYIGDFNNNEVKEIPAGSNIPIVIGSGFNHPTGVAVDNAGNVYVADRANNKIKEILAGSGNTITLASGYGNPNGVAVDAGGNVYFADTYYNSITEIPVGGGSLIAIGSGFITPTAVAVDGDNIIYIADNGNTAVKKIGHTGGFYISPALPNGLSIDNNTGIISGTPTVVSPATTYTVTGYNSGGNGTTTIVISVVSTPPTISYNSPQAYYKGVAISSLTPTSNGVAAAGYNTAPISLGSGLSHPYGLAVDGAGNLYIGDENNNSVKKIPAGGGSPVTLASITNVHGIAVDAAGNVYASDYNNNAVVKIPAGGGSPVTIGSGYNKDYFIAADPSGNVYVADNGNNAVWKIPAGGGSQVSIGSGFNAPSGIAADAIGNVYVFDSANSGSLKEIPAGGSTPIVLKSGFLSNGNFGGIAVDGTGNLYVTNSSGTVTEISAVGGTLSNIVFGNADELVGIAVDGIGNIYANDWNTNTVLKVNPIGGFYISPTLPAGLSFNNATGSISGIPTMLSPATSYAVTAYNSGGSGSATVNITVGAPPAAPTISYSTPETYIADKAITPLTPVSSGVAAPGNSNSVTTLASGLTRLTGVAVDVSGNVFMVPASTGSVYKIPAGGGSPTVYFSQNGLTGIAVDAADNLYITNTTTNTVIKVPANGSTPVTIGTGFNDAIGITVDAAGNVYVADMLNNAVKMIPAGGGAIVTLGSGFSSPTGVAVDAAGNVYVVDSGNSAIKKIPFGGGSPVIISSGQIAPQGITLDAAGNVYVSYAGYGGINEFLAGSGVKVILGAGFNGVQSIASDASGNIYLGDNDNNGNSALEEIIKPVGGYYISPALPAGLSLDNTTGIISGAPLVSSPATNYTVTAFNAGGSGSATVNLTISSPPLPSVSYSSPHTYSTGEAIAALTPTASGVALPGYNTIPVILNTGSIYPYGGVTVDAAGNLYFSDGRASVYKMSLGGGAPVVIGTGFNHPEGVTVDAAGNVYVADNQNNAVKKIPVGGGSIITLGSGFSYPAGVAVDGAGNVYVADGGNNAVKEIPVGGSAIITLGSGFGYTAGVAVDAAGNVYVADAGNNAIKKIVPGSGTPVVIGAGFNDPVGVTVDVYGNVFVADYGDIPFHEIPVSGGPVTAINSGINFPDIGGIAVDVAGNVYVAGSGNAVIAEITPNGGYFINAALPAGLSFNQTTGTITGTPTVLSPTTNYSVTAYNAGGGTSAIVNITVRLPLLAISYSSPQTYGEGTTISPLAPVSTGVASFGYSTAAPIVASGFYEPAGIAIDAAGNLYTTEGDDYVRRILADGTRVTLGSGFSAPSGIAVDAAGNVYVADQGNHAVKKIPAGNGTPVSIGSGFSMPDGVALDAAGNVYVSDEGNNTVWEIPASGGSTVALAEGFNRPAGIAVDAGGNVYVSDQGNNAVKMIPAGGGTVIMVGSGFNDPNGLAEDASGNLYISDRGNNAVKMIPAGGGTIISIGSGLTAPLGITVDGAGNAYVVDGGTQAIKEIKPVGGYFINTPLTAGLNFNNNTGSISGTPTSWGQPTSYKVTAYNANGGTYATVNITVNASASLTSLTTSSGTLSPAFAASTWVYKVNVNNATSSITLTPTTADPTATIKVNGVPVVSGTASTSIPLPLSTPVNIPVVVTALNGTGTTYSVTATRLSDNANLAGLSVSDATLTPVFSSATTVYTATVGSNISSVSVTPTTSSAYATVTVKAIPVVSGSASGEIGLSTGANTIHVVVLAQDGTQRTYTITVTKSTLSSNANLANLTISSGTLAPVFSSTVTGYTAIVSEATTSITLTPTTSDVNATVKVDGTAVKSGSASGTVPLTIGSNAVHAVVLAQDGTQRTYTVNVTRLSNDANLAKLAISSGTLTPVFSSATTGYTATVSEGTTSITVTPTTSNANANVKVDGTAVASGSASGSIPLGIGSNAIHAVVIAQDGTQRTYTVTVTRLSNNANLANLTISSGTLTPAFTSATTTYTASVSNTVTSLQVTPTTSNANATVKVNGTAVISGDASASLPLVVGSNAIHAVVLAQDGTQRTYTVTVTRAAGTTNDLFVPDPLISSLTSNNVEATNILTPNGDGVNDVWVVKNIALYPNNAVTVYDRLGKVVFTKKGYTNDWAGTYNGSVLNEGTYYYLVDLGNGKKMTGFITVVRDR